VTTAEIRKAFLDFFSANGHTVVASSSLIPAGDPTLLFVNAGMVQFKDCFLGNDKRSYVRATTCQKCLRISGKHNDLENVGRTARHHTFFEMLGNFSFGDYFKKDAIAFGWKFLTENLKLPKERLWVTIYEEDDEAEKLWRSQTDVKPERILRCGKEDNFWAMGDTGPCGPCSEIHYYLGADLNNQSEAEFRKGDGTYIEIWNLVFMQFNRDVAGALTPLPKPSVDTGMGLERVAAVKQGVLANYDIDLMRSIISFTEKLCGKSYLGKDYNPRPADEQYLYDVAFRVIADHVRACSFLIADGISPSSDGRGYVLRRLVRRACRHGRVLGFDKQFLYQVAGELVRVMGEAFPELKQSLPKIEKLLRAEEEKFLSTLDSGLSILRKEIQAVKGRSIKTLPGEVAFLLHDTYGFPLDLTEDIVRADGLTVDHEAFSAQMESQRSRSRAARAADTELVLRRTVKPLPSKFVGYEFTEYESRVRGMFSAQGELRAAHAGEEVAVITEETPFYGEAGGQVGDTGTISANDAALEVLDTQRVGGESIVHICRVIDGELGPESRVRLSIDNDRREKIRRNHSATHMLHLALREVLGDHVRQAGSRVSDDSLRFDFTHFEAISAGQTQEIEGRVNEIIRANHEVQTKVLPLEEAKRLGAMALFDEKYGDLVRVVQIGSESRELCGGTHVRRSGDLGLFVISGEGAIASGVRRIDARTGGGAFHEVSEDRQLLRAISGVLKTGESELLERLKKVLERNRELERQLEQTQQGAKLQAGSDLAAAAVMSSSGVRVISAFVEQSNPKILREMADDLRNRLGSVCLALGSVVDGKGILLIAVTEDLKAQYPAGKLLEQLSAIAGVRGGGKPDLAQAGGGDPLKIPAALEHFIELFK
jgi:alanyl-tRNA synthetase